MTNFKQEDLNVGTSFGEAIDAFFRWIGPPPVAFLTWSNTDLLVLIENFRFFRNIQTVPLMTHYADAQLYCQQIMGIPTGCQLGLRDACSQLNIPTDDMEYHRALDDSLLAVKVIRAVGDSQTLALAPVVADRRFYEKLFFKPYYLQDIDNAPSDPAVWRFTCSLCGQTLHNKSEYHYRGRAFCANLYCPDCGEKYIGKVQCRRLYDYVLVKRKLVSDSDFTDEETT